MKNLIATICTLLCASVLNVSAVTYYTNETEFLTAITGKPAYTNTFSTIATGGTRLDTNVVNFTNGSSFGYTANIPGVGTSFWGDTIGGVNAMSTGDPSDVFVMTNFSLNTFAFGGYFVPFNGTAVPTNVGINMAVVFSDLSSTNITYNRASSDLNDWFFGWVTDEPGTGVSSITMTNGLTFISSANVTLAVPEPSTYALLGLAAAGLAGYVIRRRRA